MSIFKFFPIMAFKWMLLLSRKVIDFILNYIWLNHYAFISASSFSSFFFSFTLYS